MRGRFIAAVGAAVIIGGLVPGSLAAAAPTPTGGAVRVWVKPSSTTTSAKRPGSVLLTGAIGDYGRSVTSNATGKPTKKGAYKLLRLQQGTIIVNGTTLNTALKSAFTKPTLNSTNCSIAISATAPVQMVKGTGAYVGISGSVMITASFGAVVPKSKSGSCTLKTATKPLAQYTSIFGSGTVSFS
jgi:hypothetical protein